MLYILTLLTLDLTCGGELNATAFTSSRAVLGRHLLNQLTRSLDPSRLSACDSLSSVL